MLITSGAANDDNFIKIFSEYDETARRQAIAPYEIIQHVENIACFLEDETGSCKFYDLVHLIL